MAGTLIAEVRSTAGAVGQRYITRIELSLLSASDGTLDVTTNPINGTLRGVEVVPDAGATQPTNGFNLLVKNLSTRDILIGDGAGLSNSSVLSFSPMIQASDEAATLSNVPVPLAEPLRITGSGMGSAKGTKLVLYIGQ